MNAIPRKLREELAADPFYHRCARADALHDHECVRDPLSPGKPVEWEHALILAGKQVQKRFAIVPICWFAHRGPGLNKEINIWIALNRASDQDLEDLSSYGGMDYIHHREYLNKKYGVYKPVEKCVHNVGINYGYPVGSLFI